MIRLLLLLLLLPGAARADARLSIETAGPLDEIVVVGRNAADASRALTVRVDDRPSPAYAERVNEERLVPPGPFRLRLRIAALRTPRGKPLDKAMPLRVIAFGDNLSVEPLHIETPAALPEGVHGWYFGPDWAVPLRGFESVQPGDPRLAGRNVATVNRPGGDPVLAHGMRLEKFTAALPPGRWRIALWTEDLGEWETLPPLLERRIRINGADVSVLRRSYPDWIAQRYLAGRDREADPAATPFAAIGAFRGGRVETTVTVGVDAALVVEFAGFPAAAIHLTAMTAAPADPVSAVEALRATRFGETWPVLLPPPPAPTATAISTPEPAAMARDGIAILRVQAAVLATATGAAHVEWDDTPLPTRVLWGQWRWRRPSANAAGLVFSAAHLRAEADAIPLRPDLPRPLTVIVQGGAPGVHHGHLVLEWPGGRLAAPISVEVLDVARPKPAAKVAAFLDFAPQFLADPAWDKAPARQLARAQAACDIATLHGLGLASLMPPVGRLDTDFEGVIADIRAAAAWNDGPMIAYAPLRALGAAEAGGLIAKAEAAIAAAGLPRVAWSVADEPAYNGTLDNAAAVAKIVHAAAPSAILAGHFNNPKDAALLPALGVATVNPGYGADAADITALRNKGVAPYLYNMPLPRLAAGAYLWRSGAQGFIQWHARMPTADAFDPTDGREGDVQFLWPTPGLCPPADLDADVFDLVEGAEDLRWFAWLDAAARHNVKAADLRAKLWDTVPDRWAAAERVASRALQWRQDVLDLARNLKE